MKEGHRQSIYTEHPFAFVKAEFAVWVFQCNLNVRVECAVRGARSLTSPCGVWLISCMRISESSSVINCSSQQTRPRTVPARRELLVHMGRAPRVCGSCGVYYCIVACTITVAAILAHTYDSHCGIGWPPRLQRQATRQACSARGHHAKPLPHHAKPLRVRDSSRTSPPSAQPLRIPAPRPRGHVIHSHKRRFLCHVAVVTEARSTPG